MRKTNDKIEHVSTTKSSYLVIDFTDENIGNDSQGKNDRCEGQ